MAARPVIEAMQTEPFDLVRRAAGGRPRVVAAASCLAVTAALLACGGGGGGGSSSPDAIEVTLVAIDAARVGATWSAPRVSETARYALYRDDRPLVSLPNTVTSFTDTGLMPGSSHCYRVDAIGLPTGLVIGSGAACTTTPAIATTWQAVELGSGQYPAVAIDPQGAVHATWRDGQVVMHARIAPDGTRTTDTVDPLGGRVGLPSIVVEPGGRVLVAYEREYPPGGIWLASSEGSGWTIQAVGAPTASAPALAIDPDGRPVLATNASGMLQLWTRQDGAWRSEAQRQIVGYPLRLALDAKGGRHVATTRNQDCDVSYAFDGGGGWADTFQDTGCGVGLAVGADGTAHLAYMDARVLRFASIGPSGTVREEPDRFDWIGGGHVSVAVDAQGRPHVAYVDSAGLVKHAVRTGMSWATTAVGGGGATPEIAMLPDGRAAIVHAVSGGVSGPIRLVVGQD